MLSTLKTNTILSVKTSCVHPLLLIFSATTITRCSTKGSAPPCWLYHPLPRASPPHPPKWLFALLLFAVKAPKETTVQLVHNQHYSKQHHRILARSKMEGNGSAAVPSKRRGAAALPKTTPSRKKKKLSSSVRVHGTKSTFSGGGGHLDYCRCR